jgi:hypothetical protein
MIAELRAEVARLRAAVAALIGAGNLDSVAAFELGRKAARGARGADVELDGYAKGVADGLARIPMAQTGVDPATIAAVGRIADRLNGTPPRRLHAVPPPDLA